MQALIALLLVLAAMPWSHGYISPAMMAIPISPSGEPGDRRKFVGRFGKAAVAFGASASAFQHPAPALADLPQGRSVPLDQRERQRGPPGVNKPELLPPGPMTTVIDLEKMMVGPQVTRLQGKIGKLEKETGYKLRVLTQAYPNTPGLAIKDYWTVDGNTIVLVVDRGTYRDTGAATPNILNFNVGSEVELALPPVFFTRVRNFFGGRQYVGKEGAGNAVEAAVDAVAECLRSEGGCNDVPADLK